MRCLNARRRPWPPQIGRGMIVIIAFAAGVSCANVASAIQVSSPHPKIFGHFGGAVAGLSDVNGDGRGDILVGAPGERDPVPVSGLSPGMAYIYDGYTGALIRELLPPTYTNDGSFGFAVAAVPDTDGDGINDILVGAFRDKHTDDSTHSGRVYLFSGTTGELLFAFTSPSPLSTGNFGYTVIGVPDIDGDDLGDLAVGAERETGPTGLRYAGWVYVFSGGKKTLLYSIPPQVEQLSGHFGDALAVIEGGREDGLPILAVGMPYYNTTDALFYTGRVFLYRADTGAHLATLQSPNESAPGTFGAGLAAVPDINKDGFTDLIIAAPREFTSGFDEAGSAYVYSLAGNKFLKTIISPRPAVVDGFGDSIAGLPDLDGDGRGEVSVQSSGIRDISSGPGNVRIFSGGTPTVLQLMPAPYPQEGGGFGFAQALLPDVTGDGVPDLVLAAPGESLSSEPSEAGRIYTYNPVTGQFIEPPPSPTPTESPSATPTLSPTPSATPTPVPSPSASRILDYLLGRTQDGQGLDINADGTIDAADLLAILE